MNPIDFKNLKIPLIYSLAVVPPQIPSFSGNRVSNRSAVTGTQSIQHFPQLEEKVSSEFRTFWMAFT